jgi:GT2 family glycosyltransferase
VKVSLFVKADQSDLLTLLPCINAQTYDPFEVILMTDRETCKWVQSLDRPQGNILHLYTDTNEAAKYATGDLFLFIQRDHVLEPKFIAFWVEMFLLNPNIFIVGLGALMCHRYDFIDAGGFTDQLTERLLIMENYRIETTDYISTNPINELLSGYL